MGSNPIRSAVIKILETETISVYVEIAWRNFYQRKLHQSALSQIDLGGGTEMFRRVASWGGPLPFLAVRLTCSTAAQYRILGLLDR